METEIKILSIGNFGTGWDGSICDEEHIAKALEELGHEVNRQQRDGPYGIGLESFDFILVAQWDGYDSDLITRFKRMTAAPVVYWAFDYQADGQEWHERLVKEADLYLSKRIADSKYPNWQWLAQDFAPQFLDRYKGDMFIEKDIDVLFTGSYLPWATERNETIRAVAEKFNLVIHSVNGWPEEWELDVRPPVMDKGLPELYARAKTILAIDHTLEPGYWSDRMSQIMACRGLVLGRYVPLMETRFISGTFVPFYSIKHCLEEIELQQEMAEEDLEAIREVGYQWAHRNLMVEDRVNDLLTIVESIL